MSVRVTWAWPTPAMAAATNTNTAIRMYFFIERGLKEPERLLLELFTSFTTKFVFYYQKHTTPRATLSM
jgi:hypothetical protein